MVSESRQSSSWRQTYTVHPVQRVQSEDRNGLKAFVMSYLISRLGKFPVLVGYIYTHCELKVMAHRCECLCSASQLWLPHLALCIVPPECFQGLCVWSRAMGSKSGKLWNIADCDTSQRNASLSRRRSNTSDWSSQKTMSPWI